jgi:hypothetical protein
MFGMVAAVGCVDHIALLAQGLRYPLAKLRVIFHQQNSHLVSSTHFLRAGTPTARACCRQLFRVKAAKANRKIVCF